MCFNGSVAVWGPALLVNVNCYKLVINVEMWSFTLEFIAAFRRCD